MSLHLFPCPSLLGVPRAVYAWTAYVLRDQGVPGSLTPPGPPLEQGGPGGGLSRGRSCVRNSSEKHSGLRSVRPLSSPRRRSLPVLLCMLAASLTMGCEVVEPTPPKPAGPRLYPVRGTVTVAGKPLARAVVAFLPVFSVGTPSV